MEELIKRIEEDYKETQIHWLRSKALDEKNDLEFNAGKLHVLTNILMYLYEKNK